MQNPEMLVEPAFNGLPIRLGMSPTRVLPLTAALGFLEFWISGSEFKVLGVGLRKEVFC